MKSKIILASLLIISGLAQAADYSKVADGTMVYDKVSHLSPKSDYIVNPGVVLAGVKIPISWYSFDDAVCKRLGYKRHLGTGANKGALAPKVYVLDDQGKGSIEDGNDEIISSITCAKY